jgi:hypothetical protein
MVGTVRQIIAIALAVAAVMFGITAPVSANAASPFQHLRNRGSDNLCMDIGSTAVGTPVGMYYCHYETPYASQVWFFHWDASASGFDIVNQASGLCMDVASYAPGTVVGMYPCHFSDSNYLSQKWESISNSRLRSRGNSTMCMDLGSYAVGTKVSLYWCQNDPGYLSQQWLP